MRLRRPASILASIFRFVFMLLALAMLTYPAKAQQYIFGRTDLGGVISAADLVVGGFNGDGDLHFRIRSSHAHDDLEIHCELNASRGLTPINAGVRG